MGAYVALVASELLPVHGVFLLAPALYVPGFGQQYYRSICRDVEIVHGWSDAVCPPETSIRFARETECTLHLISGDHRLNTSLPVVLGLFEQFLNRLHAHTTAD
jgi:hypothetical protein